MPRSASQRYARWLKRLQRPTFAFTKLPAELQLLVLCKCDPVTATKLLQASTYVRALYLCYAETALPAIFSQFPTPAAALFQVSWTLHNLHDDDFDPIFTLHLLGNCDMFQWPDKLLAPFMSTGDPLETLQTMTDFCLQVTDAAELVGKCLVVPVEMYLNPHACIPPIILSNNEHTRIACALWVLKIYYQLRRKFVDRAPDHANLFATAFLRNLKPWQIDQVIVVQRKVSNCYLEHHDSLNHFDQTEFGLLKRLADSQYSIKYHQTLYQARDSTRLIPHFGYYIRALIHPHRRAPSGPAMRAWWHTSNDVGHPSTPSSITTQLRNHAWICSEPTTHTVTTAHSDRYMNICRQLGLFFWDYARLLAWHLPDSDELMTVVDSHPGLSAVILRYSDRPWWEESRFQRATAVERTTQRQILEWTRCPEPCTLEEWLYQKTAKFLLEKGKDPMPRGRIKIGICCTSCGLDGHALGRGYLCPAWDLETQGQSDTSDATSG